MKKIEIKPLIITFCLVLFQSMCYLVVKLIESNPTLIGNKIDTMIPFNAHAIIPYTLWYLLIIIVPYLFYKKDKNLFMKYSFAFLLTNVFADIIFCIYPTTIIRNDLSGSGLLNTLTSFIYAIDEPVLNCFPSLHCATCFLWMFYTIKTDKLKSLMKVIIIIFSVSIVASTLFVKQHVFIDVIGGLILATIVVLIVKYLNKPLNGIKKVLKIN